MTPPRSWTAKAQIAIAVLMGQALGIPVYYKHERFDAIIPFPPMPVAEA